MTLQEAISNYGVAIKAKLGATDIAGEPEDQIRSPLENLFGELAELSNFKKSDVVLIGETTLVDIRTRPDYAVTVRKQLVGFIELKAPGKQTRVTKYKGHDKKQWEKLKSLPNLLYTDGNEFALYRNGDLIDDIVLLDGDVAEAGNALSAPDTLLPLIDNFLRWEPLPPKSMKELAVTTARLCRFLRDEVREELASENSTLAWLQQEWRKMLFPEATDEMFADGYAQAVTFGLLVAKAQGITLQDGIEKASKSLGPSNSLIAAALRILVQEAEAEKGLTNSIDTLVRVLEVVDWSKISKGQADAWLYFYEDFLSVYDNDLRKKTGSYYTPPEIVKVMVRLVDEVLKSSDRFHVKKGLADKQVTIADPAVGTGTFLLGILGKIADSVQEELGPGAVKAEIENALSRIYGFEIQLGPFAVAQLRILAEVVELTDGPLQHDLQMYVTDTLGNPFIEEEALPNTLAAIAASRKAANRVKREQSITVVIGNPPYKEKANNLGGWIEQEHLQEWQPPKEWGVSTHAKHLRNLYIYFWRWACWKVFDQTNSNNTGIVCFITVAGFLNGPGFQRMREYLREKCDEIWIIDCTPEGHQPKVSSRVFQGVQQPVCIVLASCYAKREDVPTKTHYLSLPKGSRSEKFAFLDSLTLDHNGWIDCPAAGRTPFLPQSSSQWASFPALEDFFIYNGSGVMPGRTWVIAPDQTSLERRWSKLITTAGADQEALFHPHLRKGALGDRHSAKPLKEGLRGHEARLFSVASDSGVVIQPIRYGFRSFDRQWIIPDARLINQPNPNLWDWHSNKQVYLTCLTRHAPSGGPVASLTGLIPDLHHYKGSFGGRVFPLWVDTSATAPNITPGITQYLKSHISSLIVAQDVFSYLAALTANQAYYEVFRDNLRQPGLRIPLTLDESLFMEAVEVGRHVTWLHTYGERFADPTEGRPERTPRLPKDRAPFVPSGGQVNSAELPEEMNYNAELKRLYIGKGYINNVTAEMWNYQVSGKNVLQQWFSYRRKDRSKPPMGDRRPPSKLVEIVPSGWLAEYTEDLIDLLNVLGLLIELEPKQRDLLARILDSELISVAELEAVGALVKPELPKRSPAGQGTLEEL